MTRHVRALGLMFVVLTATCATHRLPTATILVAEHRVNVEVASDPESRANGLMHRDRLDRDVGMLFIYPDNAPRSFWMKNTQIPLSIAFADDSGKIVRIGEMAPYSRDRVQSLYPAHFALEMNQGWFEDHDVTPGDYLTQLPEIVPR